ncbi:MAG: hypothetical protein IT373_38060 [Polyangiaceae bacterium]|nr:hypothetical protein [Polyangiaceae bacterium]
MLDRVHAAESSDPALRHRYGAVLAELYDAVKDERALAAACDHFRFVTGSRAPQLLRAEAANDLAICEAHLGHHGTEITAYDAALGLEVHDETRAVLYANRAEAQMYQGRMVAAVAGYRASLATLPGYAYPSMATSTHWGLAVALDRTGDLAAAFEQIELARTLDPADAAIHGPTWFYVPDYDEHWYAALGYWQHARTAVDALERVHLYADAASAWSRYLDRAPDADRWLGLAALRRRAVERELAAAQKTLDELEPMPRERPDGPALDP